MPTELTTMTALETASQLVPTKRAAQILGLSESSLANDRWEAKRSGTSPKVPYVKLPLGAIRYRMSDLKALIEACIIN